MVSPFKSNLFVSGFAWYDLFSIFYKMKIEIVIEFLIFGS